MRKIVLGVVEGWLVSIALTIPAVIVPLIRLPALFIGGFAGGMKAAEEKSKRIKRGFVSGLFIAVLNVIFVLILMLYPMEQFEFIADALLGLVGFSTSLVFGLVGLEIVSEYLPVYMLIGDCIFTCVGGVIGSFFAAKAPVESKEKIEKVPEKVPTTDKVEPAIYNFDNIFSLLEEREKSIKILKGLDGRLASGEIREETYNDLKPKYESKVGDINSKIKSELERAKAYLQRIEDERNELLKTQENLNEELIKEGGRKKRAEISTKISGINDEIERVDGIIKTMKEKIGVIEKEFSRE